MLKRKKRMAKYKVWKRGEEVLCSPLLSIDTETELIVDHNIPDIVLLQVYDGQQVQLVKWPDIPAYLDEFAKVNVTSKFIFHNVAFDISALHYPKFLIDAADQNRIIDTMFRYRLFKLEKVGFLTQSSLKVACKDILRRDIEKDDAIRCTFSRSEELSKEHYVYAADDTIHTYDLAIALGNQPTEGIQVRGSIALDYISKLGLRVDEKERSRLEEKLSGKLAHDLQVLEDNGYVPGKSGNSTVLQEYLEMLEARYGLELPRTEKSGKIQTSESAIDAIGDVLKHDPFLQAYKSRSHLNKMIKTYLKTDVIGSDGRVHTYFNPMLVTGRSSSSQPNIQNLPRAEGIRGIFVPTEGYYFAAVDYCQLELCTLAQDCLKNYGYSVLADKINAGVDCHVYLASFVFDKEMDQVTDFERQASKIANFGYPGGLSAETFISYAKGFGLDMDLETSTRLRDTWITTFPEMKEHLSPEQDASEQGKYIGRTLTGRVRGKCRYTEACNTPFQGLASDGAKEALWALFKDGTRMVNFIHDETINEIKITDKETISDEVKKIEETMINSMKKVVPDVAIRTEAALMDRWYKKAKPVYDEQGHILLWTPEEKIEDGV
jgi:DNA polymerase-1